jgi:D-alanyl-lipoteichoic acid acyltransferase DltB (MBOAT superfamily)
VTLGLVAIAVIGAAALVYSSVLPARFRPWFLLLGSIIALYALQAPLAPRFADFILPTALIGLTVAGWWLSRPERRALLAPSGQPPHDAPTPRNAPIRDDWLTLLVIALTIIGLAFFRYVDADFRLTASRPPAPLSVLLTLVEAGLVAAALALILRRLPQRAVLTGSIVFLVALFVAAKWPPATSAIAGWWRGLTGQDVTLAAPTDLVWLGFSYAAFRLIHTLRDRQTGLLPELGLRDYATYVLFAPAIVAGPIDRAERFVGDLRRLRELPGLDAGRWGLGLWRIGQGLFKKFVIADTLAQGLSLTPALAEQTQGTAALWLLLYGYGLRLYFDFGGYTDIAIGLGILFGLRLPENFDRPYTRTNLTTFWQSWHITLSNWARFYIFTPLSRTLLRHERRPSSTVIVLISQLATMLVIGLWHGITWNFFIWGLWHAVGLFAHKQWTDRTRKWYRELQQKPGPRRAWAFVGWFITFNYVMLGWVWFLLPTPAAALQTFQKLFGG